MKNTQSSFAWRKQLHWLNGASRTAPAETKANFWSSRRSFRLQYPAKRPEEFYNSLHLHVHIRKQQDCSSWLHITTYVQDTLARQWLQPTSWRLFTEQKGGKNTKERSAVSQRHFSNTLAIFLASSSCLFAPVFSSEQEQTAKWFDFFNRRHFITFPSLSHADPFDFELIIIASCTDAVFIIVRILYPLIKKENLFLFASSTWIYLLFSSYKLQLLN